MPRKSRVKRGRALIVEDDPISRRALSRLLEEAGHEVDSAQTISEAMQKIDSAPVCVILDLMLPDGNGIAVLKRIRQGQLPIRVAVATGIYDPVLFAEMKELKPDVIFMKPLNLGQVGK